MRNLLVMLLTLISLTLVGQDNNYPWLNDVLSENCCLNKKATAYDFGSYSFVYIETNEDCAPGGKLYFEDGNCWCTDKGDSFCTDFYNLSAQTGTVVYECDDSNTVTPFDQFDWLSSVASETDCNQNESITVYLKDRLQYVFVETSNGEGQLYTSSGTALCASANNYDCISLYSLSDVTLIWNCSGDVSSGNAISVYNSFEDATLTGGQQAFYGAAGPTAITDAVEFPQFINFYDIDLTETGLTMTLFNNSDAADLLLPDGRFDRYYFAYDGDVSNISIAGGSPGLADNASVTALPAGYEIPLADLFATGFSLPITLPDGGFVVELAGGTDLTELGQTLIVSFEESGLGSISVDSETFFPEDIVIANNAAYVSSLGDGSLSSFDLTQANPAPQVFAAAEEGYTQRWGVKVDGNTLFSILDNADFGGGMSGPAKLVAYDITSKAKTGEWDLPAGSIGHTVSIVDGKYYVTDFGQPRIFEIDPATGTVNDSWFTSDQWDPSISGIGGTIYDNEGGFYVSQGNKMWYLPISGGAPGTLQEVTVNGLDAVDADGITWVDNQNTLYYATNDTGDPANVGTVYKLVFSDVTTATGSVVATGYDDASGLWYRETGGKEYIYLLESQFGALFGINSFDPPFNIAVIELD